MKAPLAARCEINVAQPLPPRLATDRLRATARRAEARSAKAGRGAPATVGRPKGLRDERPPAISQRVLGRCAMMAAVVTGSVALLAQDGEWRMYSGSYSAHRFSPLTQLTPGNVAKLKPVWVYQP